MLRSSFTRSLLASALMVALALVGAGRTAAQPTTAYHADNYLRLGQNPGGLNQDVELPNGGGGTGWTEVYRYQRNWAFAVTRGLPLPSGFDFRCNGQLVTAVRASTQQWLALDTVSATATSFWPLISLPDARFAGSFVWMGEECGPNSSAYGFNGARIYTKTFGTAPHRQFWVQWNNLPKNHDPILGMLPAYVSIVLEETTNRVFIVFQRMGWGWRARTRAGIQLSPTTAVVADSMEIPNPWQNDVTPADNLAHVFEPGPRPACDAALWAGHVPERLPSAAGAPPTPLGGAIVNLGTQPLAPGWQLHARLGTGAVQTVTGTTPLAPGDTAAVVFPTLWDRAAYGTHRLQLWVTTAAAQPDANPANDSLAYLLHVASREVPRRVLQELATSSTCLPCVEHDDSLRVRDRRHPDWPVERIAYPMNFPGAGDPYTLPEFVARARVNQANMRNYNLLLPFATPMMYANGYAFVDATDRFLVPLRPRYDSTMNRLFAPPTYLEMTGTCRVGGDTIRGAITLTPTRFLPGGSHTLRVVVVERSTRNNASTNGQIEFHNVAKKIVLNRVLAAPLLPEQPLTVPYSFFFGPGHTVEHFDSLEVVAFVQHSQAAGTMVPSEVIQVTRLRPAHLPPLGAPAPGPDAMPSWTLAPNPAAGRALVRLSLPVAQAVAVEMRDALGRLVLNQPAQLRAAGAHALPLELRGLAPGVYAVRVLLDGRAHTRRLVVE